MKFFNIDKELLVFSMKSALINAVISGILNWFKVKDKTVLFLSVDAISNTEKTVLGESVMIATSIATLITFVNYIKLKSKEKPPFFPNAVLLILRNAFFVFGVMVTLSILIQRFAGSIIVTPLLSELIIGFISWLVATVINYMSYNELFNKK